MNVEVSLCPNLDRVAQNSFLSSSPHVQRFSVLIALRIEPIFLLFSHPSTPFFKQLTYKLGLDIKTHMKSHASTLLRHAFANLTYYMKITEANKVIHPFFFLQFSNL